MKVVFPPQKLRSGKHSRMFEGNIGMARRIEALLSSTPATFNRTIAGLPVEHSISFSRLC